MYSVKNVIDCKSSWILFDVAVENVASDVKRLQSLPIFVTFDFVLALLFFEHIRQILEIRRVTR
jgi:hypothetical protein